jgi:hypothetical protein
VAVASFQPPAVVYREEQNFHWWVYALLASVELLIVTVLVIFERKGHEFAVSSPLASLAFGTFALVNLGTPLLILVGLLRMTTEVTPSDIRIWFGWLPTYRRFVSLDSVVRLEVVSYRPVADFGGWGIRRGRDGERGLTARGNRGVRLELADGTMLLVGSQSPETLAVAIERALHPGG